jgi:hypothetical protein
MHTVCHGNSACWHSFDTVRTTITNIDAVPADLKYSAHGSVIFAVGNTQKTSFFASSIHMVPYELLFGIVRQGILRIYLIQCLRTVMLIIKILAFVLASQATCVALEAVALSVAAPLIKTVHSDFTALYVI